MMFLIPTLPVNIATADGPISWDLLDQPWDSISGWTKGGSGTSEISPSGQLHHSPDSSGGYVERYKDIGSLPESGYTVEMYAYIDAFANNAGELYLDLWDGMHAIYIGISKNTVRERNNQQFSLTTDSGVWYNWRFVIDSDSDLVKVYRNSTYVGQFASSLYNSASNDGYVYVGTSNPASYVGTETHIEYLKIATGLRPPLPPLYYPRYHDDFENGKKSEWSYDNGSYPRIVEISTDYSKETSSHSLHIKNLEDTQGGYWGQNNGVAYAKLDMREIGFIIDGWTMEFWFYPAQSAFRPYYNQFMIFCGDNDINLFLDDDPSPGGVYVSDANGEHLISTSFTMQTWHKITYTWVNESYCILKIDDGHTYYGAFDPYAVGGGHPFSNYTYFGDYYSSYAKGDGYWDDFKVYITSMTQYYDSGDGDWESNQEVRNVVKNCGFDTGTFRNWEFVGNVDNSKASGSATGYSWKREVETKYAYSSNHGVRLYTQENGAVQSYVSQGIRQLVYGQYVNINFKIAEMTDTQDVGFIVSIINASDTSSVYRYCYNINSNYNTSLFNKHEQISTGKWYSRTLHVTFDYCAEHGYLTSSYYLAISAYADSATADVYVDDISITNDDNYKEFGIEYINDYSDYNGSGGSLSNLSYSDDIAYGFAKELNNILNGIGEQVWTEGINYSDDGAGEEYFENYSVNGTIIYGEDHLFDSYRVDDVDFVCFVGHGNPNGFLFGTNRDGDNDADYRYMVHHREARWGDNDLDWIVICACDVLKFNDSTGHVFVRWGYAFRGLHGICSFSTTFYQNATSGAVGETFVTYTKTPYPVAYSWKKATQDCQGDGIKGAYIGTNECTLDYLPGYGYMSPDEDFSQTLTGLEWSEWEC
ncbi:MAG: DUF6345 domain-containing protein [Thermoplasmata archaeon]